MNAQHETISQKADRLKNNYRVILIGPDQAIVIGDHDTYQVRRKMATWQCDCPWGRYRGHWKACSHVTAVKRAWNDPMSQGQVARLAELLASATN